MTGKLSRFISACFIALCFFTLIAGPVGAQSSEADASSAVNRVLFSGTVGMPVQLNATAQSDAVVEPESAGRSNFWPAVRRFEIVAFGTLPFTMFFANLGYDIGRYGYYGFSYGFDSQITGQYQPLLFGDRSFTQDERAWILASAAGVSIVLATIDAIIERRVQNRRGSIQP